MHVARRRSYQLRLLSIVSPVRCVYVSAARRRHLPLIIFTDREVAYPSRMPSTPKHEARTSIVRSGHQGPDGRCRLADQRAASANIASMHVIVTTRRLKASERLEGLMPNLAGRSVEREQWKRGYQPVSCARNLLDCVGVQVILQQADSAWVPAHPFPSTADLAALHAKANWLTVPVADQQRCSGTAIFVRSRILEAPGSAGRVNFREEEGALCDLVDETLARGRRESHRTGAIPCGRMTHLQ
jgi:hypothetical protein